MKFNKTSLNIAVEKGNKEIVELLLSQKEVDPNQKIILIELVLILFSNKLFFLFYFKNIILFITFLYLIFFIAFYNLMLFITF